MSFVFDQIDAIEKERSQKDETLQRIRAWRESKTKKYTNNDDTTNVNPSSSSSTSVGGDFGSAASGENGGGLMMRKGVEMVHPWPEWIELMERLVRQNYFDHRRKDEDRMVEDLGFQVEEVVEEGVDFTRDWKTVQTACLNFGKDRFDILRFVVFFFCFCELLLLFGFVDVISMWKKDVSLRFGNWILVVKGLPCLDRFFSLVLLY